MNDRTNQFDFQSYKSHLTWEVSAFVFIMNAVISLICTPVRGVGFQRNMI
ncbi:MAG: hypothetical protein Q7S16_04960 [bacterium]|nr:hypothetical protein [bacterium]